MKRKTRHDKYCTVKSAPDVLRYMIARADQMAILFKVPAEQSGQFIHELKELQPEDRKLQSKLTALCLKWDASEQLEYKKFRGRLRRYIFSSKKPEFLAISQSTKIMLDQFIAEETLQGADEAISQLLKYWKINQITVD
ncbi:hypothetical protein [Citrobacter freundii]|uniref:hypothetical protein n=1 Tax=Citrobacter freundii TaxID=546 RepID=UPI003F9A2279